MSNNSIITILKFLILGALIGVLVLHPLTMALYWFEFNPPEAAGVSLLDFIFKKMGAAFYGKMLFMTLAFSTIGAFLGLFFWFYHRSLSARERLIFSLSGELDRDIYSLIKNGETETLEFKSSARWDFRQNKTNKALELVIVKAISGFMNHKGGTLLIGVDDEGQSLGLEKDYNSLRKKNSDGYEQFIIGLISSYMATDLCQNISVIFQMVNSNEICRIIISPSQRPAFCQNGNDTHFFLRTGGGTRELNVKEATEYIATKWPKHS
ncbi:MAG: ATP-binding protein [Gammaproteobacteria bacterium]|nr:ATP-binding protein [Gammaproteobacteria bacterium]